MSGWIHPKFLLISINRTINIVQIIPNLLHFKSYIKSEHVILFCKQELEGGMYPLMQCGSLLEIITQS